MTKQTKKRIRDVLIIVRKLLLLLSFAFILLTAATADFKNLAPMLICFAIAMICFGISYFCDYLLGGGYQSPFYH